MAWLLDDWPFVDALNLHPFGLLIIITIETRLKRGVNVLMMLC